MDQQYLFYKFFVNGFVYGMLLYMINEFDYKKIKKILISIATAIVIILAMIFA